LAADPAPVKKNQKMPEVLLRRTNPSPLVASGAKKLPKQRNWKEEESEKSAERTLPKRIGRGKKDGETLESHARARKATTIK